MATFNSASKPKPIKIENFLGINEAVGETEVNPGEWISGFNARVTKDYKIRKRPGHHTFVDFENSLDTQGLWYGIIDGREVLIMCNDGNVYEYDMTQGESISSPWFDIEAWIDSEGWIDGGSNTISSLITNGVVTIIGTITDAKTSIFWFYDKVYFLNGTDYKEYDGTTYQDVETYTPTIALNAPPSGGGTLFEEVNLLSGSKIQNFTSDGTTAVYQLAETDLDSVDEVIVDGTTLTVTTDYTVNLTLGQVTFVVIPGSEADVNIEMVKVTSGNADLVKNHKYAIDFGVNNDTNLFIFGNENEKHVFRYSGLADAGYFPANSFVSVGSTEFAITSLTPQYQSLLVFKEGATFIVNPVNNPNYEDNTGLNPYDFGYEGLNGKIGNLPFNGVQLINDTPVSLDGFSFRQFVSNTSVRNEVEPVIISDRLKLSLQDIDLSTASTFDYEYEKELWVNVDDIVYIWNYGNDTMYKYSNISGIDFIDVKGNIYFGANGQVNRFDESFVADGEDLGDNITMKLYGGFLDFGALEYRKNMRYEWLAIKPESQTSVNVKFVTDKKNEDDSKWFVGAEYRLLDFNNIDFNNFSFLTNRSAQVNRIRAKIKKFTYLQWIFENDSNNETLVILKLLLNAEVRGYSK